MQPEGTTAAVPLAPGSATVAAVPIPWRILIITLLASTLSNMDQSMFGYAVPGIMTDLKIGLPSIGLLISASFAFAIIAAPLISAQVARVGAPTVLALSVAASALFVGLQAFASGVMSFGVARVMGFGISAVIIPVSGAYLATHSPERGRAMLIAVQQCGYPLGWFVASLLAAPLLQSHGWRATFMVGFVVVPLSFLIYRLLPRETSSFTAAKSASAQAGLKSLLAGDRARITLTFGVAFFLYGGAIGGTSFYLPTFFQQVRGYDAATATQVVGLSYAVGMIGYMGAAFVSEMWLSRVATVVVWLVVASAGLLATIWLPHSVHQDMLAFGATTIFFYGASSIMLTALLEYFPSQLRSAAAAVAGTACISLGFVVFPLITAAAVGRIGWSMSFSCLIVPAVLISAMLIGSLPRRR